MFVDTWQSVGMLAFTNPSSTLPTAIPYVFRKRLIKVGTTAISTAAVKIKPSWHRSGYLEQRIGTQLVTSRSVALNQQTIFVMPLLKPYRLYFKPVHWLPNVRVHFFEYAGDETAELLEEASRM
jgi:hypothetical protein